MVTEDRLFPDIAIPPGELLAEELEARGMSQAELANRMGRPQQKISEIVNGKKAITNATALELEKVLGIPAHFWINSEASYQLTKARLAEQERLEEEAEWLDQFPVAEMLKRKLISPRPGGAERAREVLKFLGVSSFQTWQARQAVTFRVTGGTDVSVGVLQAWLREGELTGMELATGPFDRARFHRTLVNLRPFSTKRPEMFRNAIQENCADAGVAVAFVREYPGIGVTGAALWLHRRKGLIVLNLRHKWLDTLWFTFYHESAHLLQRHRGVHIDAQGVDRDHAQENAADAFATDLLIPRADWDAFIAMRSFDAASIRAFAAKQAIHTGIVVGRLQHEGLVPWNSRLNRLLKPRLKWTEN